MNLLAEGFFYLLLSEVSYYLNNNTGIPAVTCHERILFLNDTYSCTSPSVNLPPIMLNVNELRQTEFKYNIPGRT
jgi:hypothetical protein